MFFTRIIVNPLTFKVSVLLAVFSAVSIRWRRRFIVPRVDGRRPLPIRKVTRSGTLTSRAPAVVRHDIRTRVVIFRFFARRRDGFFVDNEFISIWISFRLSVRATARRRHCRRRRRRHRCLRFISLDTRPWRLPVHSRIILCVSHSYRRNNNTITTRAESIERRVSRKFRVRNTVRTTYNYFNRGLKLESDRFSATVILFLIIIPDRRSRTPRWETFDKIYRCIETVR